MCSCENNIFVLYVLPNKLIPVIWTRTLKTYIKILKNTLILVGKKVVLYGNLWKSVSLLPHRRNE